MSPAAVSGLERQVFGINGSGAGQIQVKLCTRVAAAQEQQGKRADGDDFVNSHKAVAARLGFLLVAMFFTPYVFALAALISATAASDTCIQDNLVGVWLASSATALNEDVASVITVSPSFVASCANVSSTFGTCSWQGNATLRLLSASQLTLQAPGLGTITGYPILNCTMLRWSNGDVWLQQDPRVASVHIVYMTHRKLWADACDCFHLAFLFVLASCESPKRHRIDCRAPAFMRFWMFIGAILWYISKCDHSV